MTLPITINTPHRKSMIAFSMTMESFKNDEVFPVLYQPGDREYTPEERFNMLIWVAQGTTMIDPECRNMGAPCTWEEFEAEYNRQYAIIDYVKNRTDAYPSIQEQLGMLYHDIVNGNLENGTWMDAINAVKEQFPKP